MIMTRLFTAAAAVALMSGAALAQSAPAAPVAAIAPVAGPVVANGDLIQTAKASGQFTTLLKALDATNLTSVLKTNPNLTLFAPTDAAFAALPAGELDRLMKPENAATLQKVLTYHLINTKVDSSQIAGGKVEVKTVEGLSVALDGSGDTPMVDGAKIVQADVMATNGVLHVVDKVLLPSDVPGLQASAATDATVAVNVAADASTSATETAGVIPMSSQSPEAQATLKAGDLNVVSNPPVADTPENRAKFGKPISNAGKSTPPKGN